VKIKLLLRNNWSGWP